MANQNKPDVRVRLSAEGIKEVTDALKKIADEAVKNGNRAKSSFEGLTATLGGVRGLVSKLSIAVSAVSLKNLAQDALDYADAVGVAAQATGSSTENFSALNLAATTAGLSMDELTVSLTRTAKSVGELQKGNKEAIRSFAELGLSAQDFAGKDTVQAFDTIAQRLGKLPDGLRKTQLAQDLLGKSGAKLNVLMNDLAQNGFDSFAESAERMGLTVSQQTALLADAVNDSFDLMKLQVRGVAVQFLSGLLPSVKRAMDGFQEEVSGKGVKSMHDFGQEAGRILRVMIATFKFFGNIVVGIFKSIGDGIGALAAAGAAVFRGDFSEAANIVRDRFSRTFEDIKNIGIQAGKDFRRAVEEANKEKIEIDIEPRIQDSTFADVESAEEEKAREKRERSEESAHKKRLERARELARERVAANEKLFDIETQLLEATGNREEVFERNLQKQKEEINGILDILKVADAERAAFLQRFEEIQRGAFNLDNLKQNFEEAMDQLDAARERISINAEAGVLTQFQAQQQILQLEAERIPQLQQILALLEAQAEAIGPEAVKSIEAYRKEIGELTLMNKAATDSAMQLQGAMGEGLQTGLESTLKNFRDISNAGDLVKGVMQSIADAVLQLAAKLLAQRAALAILSSFGGGGASAGAAAGSAVGAASGGHITGPGSGTSDSIPAWLSNGEFVVRAAAVKQPGVLEMLHQLNGSTRALRSFRSGVPRFAGGGQATNLAAPGKNKPSIRINNIVSDSFVIDALGTPAGEEVVMNIIERNPSRTRRVVS